MRLELGPERWEEMDEHREAKRSSRLRSWPTPRCGRGEICLEDPPKGRIIFKTASFTSLLLFYFYQIKLLAFYIYLFSQKHYPKGICV